MNKKYNIVVTGCGGDIGQSIGKILKSEPMFGDVIGCDVNDQHPGKFIYDQCLIVPVCRSNKYCEELRKIIQTYEIHIVLTASEPELRFFTEKKIDGEIAERPAIMANLRAREIGFDKYFTAKFLEEEGLTFPVTSIAADTVSPVFPVVFKSRTASGGKSLFVTSDKEDFSFYAKKYSAYIVQEYLDNEEEEYTCGLFRDMKGEIRTLVYRRKLMDSFSVFGTVVKNEEINTLLIKIANRLNLRGSINLQLRMADRGPVVFEINPRFSSTVRFKHMMGFKDVIWSIQDRVGLKIMPYTAPAEGKRFYKGFTEYID